MSTGWLRYRGSIPVTIDGYIAAMENRRQYFKDNGAVSSDHSHLDARTDTLEIAEAERIYASARKGEVTEVEATALRRHLISEMARMACDDGLVMTLHPGVRRNHHLPDVREVRRRCWDRHPGPDGVHRRAASDVEPLRHPSQFPARRSSPSTRPFSPERSARLLASIPRSSLASLGGLSTRPRRSAASAPQSLSPPASPRPPASSTTPGPSARFPLGTTCPAGLTQGSSRSWLTSTASAWTRPSMSCMISWLRTRERPSSCDSRPRSSPPFPFAARHACGCTGPDGAPRRRQLPPRPPGLVHRPRSRCRRVGYRRFHRPAPRHGATPSPPRTAFTP